MYAPHHLLYVRDLLTALDTILTHVDYLQFEPFNEDALYHAEEGRQLARFRTLQSQQSQTKRYAEGHTEHVYNFEDEFLPWIPSRRPWRS